MALEKSTPYRNAWYRDLLEKEKELKEYTDEKVAQAIELPEVTSEDNGDLLAADDGSWVKSDKLKTIMNAGVEQVGKIPMVGAQGNWGLTDYPSNELPSVTSEDNGKVLGVTNGDWGVVTPSTKGLVIFEIDSRYNSNALLNNKKISDVIAAITDGYDVALKKGANLFRLITEPTNNTTVYEFICFNRTSSNNIAVYYLYADATNTGNTFTASDIFRCVLSPSSRNKKLLAVNNYNFEYIDPELPTVSASDDGSILQVVNGAWAKSAPVSPIAVYDICFDDFTYDSGTQQYVGKAYWGRVKETTKEIINNSTSFCTQMEADLIAGKTVLLAIWMDNSVTTTLVYRDIIGGTRLVVANRTGTVDARGQYFFPDPWGATVSYSYMKNDTSLTTDGSFYVTQVR